MTITRDDFDTIERYNDGRKPMLHENSSMALVDHMWKEAGHLATLALMRIMVVNCGYRNQSSNHHGRRDQKNDKP